MGRNPIEPTCCPRKHLQRHPLPLGDPFGWYFRYKKGVLPLQGGWFDQPNVYVETMDLLSMLVADTQTRQRFSLHKEMEKAKENNHGVPTKFGR